MFPHTAKILINNVKINPLFTVEFYSRWLGLSSNETRGEGTLQIDISLKEFCRLNQLLNFKPSKGYIIGLPDEGIEFACNLFVFSACEGDADYAEKMDDDYPHARLQFKFYFH